MQKAQLSIDFLVALIAFFVFIQVVLEFHENMTLSQEKSLIRLQAKQILSEINKVLKYSTSLEANERYFLRLKVPKIRLTRSLGSGKNALIDCDVNVTPNLIELKVNSTHYPFLATTEEIIESIPHVFDENFGQVFRCGENLTIKNNTECGDSIIQGWEECDCGTDAICKADELNNQSCNTFYSDLNISGFVDCFLPGTPNECTFDISACTSTACTLAGGTCKIVCDTIPIQEIEAPTGETQCGIGQICCVQENVCANSVIEPSFGEECDFFNGNALFSPDSSCESLGFDKGFLSCNPIGAGNECTINSTSCSQCGNSLIEQGEECDTAQLNGQTCQTIGFFAGTLACYPGGELPDPPNECSFDTSLCHNCGNGAVDSGEECDTTGTFNCTDFPGGNFSGGTYSCYSAGNPNQCTWNLSSCT